MKKGTFSLLLLTTFLCLGCNKTVDLGEPLTDNEKMDFLRTVNDNMSLIPDGWYKFTYKEYGVKSEFTFEIKNISFENEKWEYNISNLYGKVDITVKNKFLDKFYYVKENSFYKKTVEQDGTLYRAKYFKHVDQIKFWKDFFNPNEIFNIYNDSYLVENTFYCIERESTEPYSLLMYDRRIEITYSKDFKKIVKGVQSNIGTVSFYAPDKRNIKQEFTIKPCTPIEINFALDERAEIYETSESEVLIYR